MLTAASLCFCKLLNPSASERLLIPNPLEASSSLRLCLPHREIDIIVPIVFIVSIISIITIPAILAIPPFPPIGGLFRQKPIRFSLRQKPFRFFRADATKNREPSDLTPDYSFQAKAFPIISFRQKPFQLSLSGYRLSDLFWLNACIKKNFRFRSYVLV